MGELSHLDFSALAGPEHADCRQVVEALRHRLLVATDRAVAAESELARVLGEAEFDRAQQQIAYDQVAGARDLAEAAGERARAEHEQMKGKLESAEASRRQAQRRLTELHESTTWRVGHLIVGGASRVRRRVVGRR